MPKKNEKFVLTQENYYGEQANKLYMSKSQFHSFQMCEAATLAEINGEWERGPSVALSVGSFIDAALDSDEELQKFCESHPEIYTAKKELKAEYKKASESVARTKMDRLFTLLMSGEKQVILEGTIGGVKFRGKADVINNVEICKQIMAEFPDTAEILGGPYCEGCIVDLKSTKDFEPIWSDSEGRKVNWCDFYGYPTQGAVYRELYRQMTGKKLPFVICGVTKETQPDIGAFAFPGAHLDAALHEVEQMAPHYQAVKNGTVAPVRCGHCNYCKATRKLDRIVNYKEFDFM